MNDAVATAVADPDREPIPPPHHFTVAPIPWGASSVVACSAHERESRR